MRSTAAARSFAGAAGSCAVSSGRKNAARRRHMARGSVPRRSPGRTRLLPSRPVKRTPGLLFIFVTALLDVLGFGLLIPVGPHLVQQLQGGGEKEAAPFVGWLVATYAAMQF